MYYHDKYSHTRTLKQMYFFFENIYGHQTEDHQIDKGNQNICLTVRSQSIDGTFKARNVIVCVDDTLIGEYSVILFSVLS